MFTYIEQFARSGRLRRARPQLSKVAVPGGSPFFILRAAARFPASELFRLAGRCAPVVLTDLPIPPDVPVRRFTPNAFPQRRTANALLCLLRDAALSPQRVTIGIRDPQGALRGQVCAFLPYAADVRIVTRNAGAFDADILCAVREWGAGLTAGEDDALLDDCTILMDEKCCTVQDRLSIAPTPVVLPPVYEARRPQLVQPEMFAAALFELCGVQAPAILQTDGVLLDGEINTFSQAAQRFADLS